MNLYSIKPIQTISLFRIFLSEIPSGFQIFLSEIYQIFIQSLHKTPLANSRFGCTLWWIGEPTVNQTNGGMRMSKAIWFSRHEPTEVQIRQIRNMGHELIRVPYVEEMAGLNLSTWEQVSFIIHAINALCDIKNIEAIFGVFPAPLQNRITGDAVEEWKEQWENGEERLLVSCYTAWNIMRSVEGGKPTFEHKTWVWSGCLDVTDYRKCGEYLDPDVIRAFIDRVRSGE